VSNRLTRREALARAAAAAAVLPLAGCAWPGRAERFAADAWINAGDAEADARNSLSSELARHIDQETGGAELLSAVRSNLGRITLLPRRLVDVSRLDLGSELLGTPLFTPLLPGPSRLFSTTHHDGSSEVRRGAAIARAVPIIECEPDEIDDRDNTGAPFWWCPPSTLSIDAVTSTLPALASRGCTAVGVSAAADPRAFERIERLHYSNTLPVIATGIAGPTHAQAAIRRGAHAVMLSAAAMRAAGESDFVRTLQNTTAAAGSTPVIWSGGIRRGADAVKILALGARAVTIDAPVLWGLAAHGAAGVERVLELLQTELAYAMGMSGRPDLASLDASLLRLHRADLDSWR
jgi:4-hydroxymandelate oxidase